MSTASLVAISTLLGSAVGGLVTYFTTKSLKAQEWRQERRARRSEMHRDLYSAYMAECGRLFLVLHGMLWV